MMSTNSILYQTTDFQNQLYANPYEDTHIFEDFLCESDQLFKTKQEATEDHAEEEVNIKSQVDLEEIDLLDYTPDFAENGENDFQEEINSSKAENSGSPYNSTRSAEIEDQEVESSDVKEEGEEKDQTILLTSEGSSPPPNPPNRPPSKRNKSKKGGQSKHLFREDNIIKATIRAGNKLIKTLVLRHLEERHRIYGEVNYKKKYARMKKELYNLLKLLITIVTGHDFKDREFKGIYAIIFHMCIKKKDPMNSMIKFANRSEKASVKAELAAYTKQGKRYTKRDGQFCLDHIVMKIAKKLYFSDSSLKKVFDDQIMSENKKFVSDKPRYLLAVQEMLGTVGDL